MTPITFEMIITALTVAAGFSLLIERLVEALKHIIESGNASPTDKKSTVEQIKDAARLVEGIRKHLPDIDKNDLTPKQIADAIGKELGSTSAAETQPSQRIAAADAPFDGDITNPVEFERNSPFAIKRLQALSDGDRDRRKLQLFYLLAAVGMGIIIAHSMDLHLLSMLMLKSQLVGNADPTLGEKGFLFLDMLLTGLVIAGGSQPIHILLRFLTTRKPPESLNEVLEDESEESKFVAAKEGPQISANASLAAVTTEKQAAAPSATTIPASAPNTSLQAKIDRGGWLAVEYHGGVKPDSLQNRNIRAADPNLIVYHHTAMSSNLGFQAIVDEFLVNKGWSTGYHCVIMPNGAIRPFCRWDRVGNHTKERNNRSLGVSFHGNFHIEKDDKFSNYDGRFGNKEPAEAQLISGARLIALWAHLYQDIELDFDSHILPHREAAPGHTVCPGSNFPFEDLQALISQYYEQWQASAYALDQIELFKKKPYLYKAGVPQ